MIKILFLVFSLCERGFRLLCRWFWNWHHNLLLDFYKVKHGKCYFRGRTFFRIETDSRCKIGDNFKVNSGIAYCIDNNKSKIVIKKNAQLLIGNNSGISSTCILCYNSIIIGDNVNIGAGTIIFDTNFHSTNALLRADRRVDTKNALTEPIKIGNKVFIGAHCVITKGVTIGDNSIIAAGSVVVKSIPCNEIWGGNPARFIKNIES